MICKTIYKDNLLPADSYVVECGEHKKTFQRGEETLVGMWIMGIWKEEIFPTPAYIYKNIGWDMDHILYCKYELKED